MLTDLRQQEVFLVWVKLTSEQFEKWVEQRPDRMEIRRLILDLTVVREEI